MVVDTVVVVTAVFQLGSSQFDFPEWSAEWSAFPEWSVFSFYKICVGNQWGYKICDPS